MDSDQLFEATINRGALGLLGIKIDCVHPDYGPVYTLIEHCGDAEQVLLRNAAPWHVLLKIATVLNPNRVRPPDSFPAAIPEHIDVIAWLNAGSVHKVSWVGVGVDLNAPMGADGRIVMLPHPDGGLVRPSNLGALIEAFNAERVRRAQRVLAA